MGNYVEIMLQSLIICFLQISIFFQLEVDSDGSTFNGKIVETKITVRKSEMHKL